MTRKKLLKSFAMSGGVAITLAPMTIAASCGESTEIINLDKSPEISKFLAGIKVDSATSTKDAVVWMPLQAAPANVAVAVLVLGNYTVAKAPEKPTEAEKAVAAQEAPIGAWKDAATIKDAATGKDDVEATKEAFAKLPKFVDVEVSKRHLWVYLDVAKGYSISEHYFDLTETSGIKNIV